jgi:hypothetical protein
MLALYDLTRDSLEHEGAMRAVFYLAVFPTAFFMAQVYTEGLFVGLAFGSLALLRRRGWCLVPAALLAAAAALTRAVGVALVIPMALAWIRTGDWRDLDMEWREIFFFFKAPRKRVFISLGKALLAFAPLVAFLFWKLSRLGANFDFVEANFFRRGLFDFGTAFFVWADAIKSIFTAAPARSAYFLTELLGLAVGTATCVACVKRMPELAWFSLAVLVISWGSGPAQGIQRYVLAAPAVFYMLSYWLGKRPALDRAWTILSTMLMGFLAMLFAFNMWVA